MKHNINNAAAKADTITQPPSRREDGVGKMCCESIPDALQDEQRVRLKPVNTIATSNTTIKSNITQFEIQEVDDVQERLLRNVLYL